MERKQIRIVGLGDYANYYSYFTYGILEGAIRCGAWFRPVHLFQQLTDVRSQIDFFKPHIIIAHCIFNRKPHNRDDVFQLLADFRVKYGAKIYYHMGDARDTPRYPHSIKDFVDGGLVNNLDYDKWSAIWGVPCIHWPYMSLQQKKIFKYDSRFDADVVFTGSVGAKEGHHAARTEFLEVLKSKGIKVKIYPDEVFGNSRFLTAEVSASSRVVIGTQMGGDIKGYVDVRPWQYIGSGALYFHEKHPNMDYYFVDGDHYISYTNVDDFISKWEMFKSGNSNLSNATRRIREEGFKYCQEHQSTKQRMEAILKFYEGLHRVPFTIDNARYELYEERSYYA